MVPHRGAMAETKISGSLARRIVWVFILLVIMPLILYVGFLWAREYKIKKQSATSEMQLIGKFATSYLNLWRKGILSEETQKVDVPREGLSFYIDQGKLFAVKREGGEYVGGFESLETWKQNFGFPFVSFVENEDKPVRGIHLDVPVQEANFVIRVALTPEEIAQYSGGEVLFHILILLAIVVIIGGLGALFLIFRISKPFRQLQQVMGAVESGNYEAQYSPDRFGFEINDLGQNFNGMLSSLLQNMEKAKELEIGRSVQNQLLPKEIPEFPGLFIGSGFAPAKEVAGDFYDLFVRGEDELLIAVADGSGKGVSACFYSLLVRSMLRSHALAGEELKEIVQKTNTLFCKDTGDTGNFVTAWVGLYNAKSRMLEYSSAGHMPGVLIEESGDIKELGTEGIALGAMETDQISTGSVKLKIGDLLILYSDGVTEAHNEKGELFEKARLIEFLSAHRSLQPQELIDHLIEEVNQFAGELAQHDDLTALCVKIT
ncbi:MAG: SpoIIE family protein phosphatase [Simkaniaceae bacterium]|nr:SpoIIE family protein phosphatase [Candidatus Sacchlamyda saccharinae]